MYKKYVKIPKPDNDVKIWKYMKLKWFKKLLKTKSLFFRRIDQFDDLFEGRSSDELHSFFEQQKELTCADCWSQDDYESNLMWKAYIGKKKGIAIQSSVGRLCKCFDDPEIDQYIGTVIYDNSDLLPEDLSLIPFFRKKEEFKSEKEIRVMCQNINSDPFPKKGIHVPVILTELIENIYTPPNSSINFITKVEKIASKFNFEIPIKASELIYRPNTISTNQKYPPWIVIKKPYNANGSDSSGNMVVESVSSGQNIDGPRTIIVTGQKNNH